MHDNHNSSRGRGGALLPAARLWRRQSAKGLHYLAGRLGGVRVLIMPKREDEDGDHTHTLFFAEPSPAHQRDGGTTDGR
jgi:hypothetical protein